MGLIDVEFYLRDGPFSSDVGSVNLHPWKRTYWVEYINENFFDSHGCGPAQKLVKFNMKQERHCLYSEYKIPGLTIAKNLIVQVIVFI